MVLPEPFADFFQNSSSNRHLEKLQVLLKDQGHLSTLILVILLGHIDSIFPGKRCRRELGKHKVSTQITGEKLLEEPKRSVPSARGSQTFLHAPLTAPLSLLTLFLHLLSLPRGWL